MNNSNDNFELTPEEFEAIGRVIDLGINSPEIDDDVDHRDDIMLWAGEAYAKICDQFEASQKKREGR